MCIFMEVLYPKRSRMEFIQKKIFIAIAWLFTYFTPVGELLLLVGLIVFLDTVTGSMVAWKNGTYNSKKAFNVVYKTIVYMSAVLISYIIQNVFEIDFADKITVGYIVYTELLSIDENSEVILGKRIFSHILGKLKRK